MSHKFLLTTLLLLCMDLLNLTLSQESIEIVPVKLLEINKCSGSSIIEETINLPSPLLIRQSINSTKARIEIRLIQSQTGLDCNETNVTLLNVSLLETLKEENFTSTPFFLSNGYMKYNGTNFSPEEFCLQSKSESNLELKICIQNQVICSPKSICIKKCCDVDQVLDLSQFASEGKLACRQVDQNNGKSNNYWTPHLYQDPYTKAASNNNVKINFIPHYPKSFCGDDVILMSLRPTDKYEAITPFRILQDGSITEKIGRSHWTLVDSFSACVDGAQNFPLYNNNDDENNDESALSGPFTGDEKNTVVIDCRSFVFSERDEQNEKFTGVYVIALLVATIFLVLTLLAHIILWKRQTIRGWTLMCYVSFLALEFILLIIARLIKEHGVACFTSSVGVHFTALATFSWLTVINFDVVWSFKTMNPCATRKEQLKLFLFYTVFATAIPVCIITLGLILENIYGDDPFSEVIVPEYGKVRCGLGISAEFPYLFGPMSILLTTNFIFLVVTLYYVYKHQKILRSNGLKTQILNDKIRFFGMLFLVAGFTWIFDVISWATTPTNASTPWYWMFFDFVNIFQAIAIFLIFVCNRTTMNHLEKEIPCLSKLKLWSPKPTEQMNLPTHGNNMHFGTGIDANRKLSITQIFSITENGHFELN